mmetsp:Transcript_4112/g.3574  ORF Transcript_4112/g.3574 Transcript_4112/m.3574 type:complete len:373 (-) Transcript_4112:124-1242(-)
MSIFPLPALKRVIPQITKVKKLKVQPPIYAPKINKTVLRSRIGLDNLHALENGIKDVTINVHQTKEFFKCSSKLYRLVYNMNQYGICLINLKGFDNTTFGHRKFLKKNMYDLKPLFGETAFHQKSEANTGILTIDPREPNSVNVANTKINHPLHTDGAFQKRPEKIVTLTCEHAAINGDHNFGETTLICAQSMLNSVLSMINKKHKVISNLFMKDAIQIGRKLPNNNNNHNKNILEELQSKQSVLSYLHEYDDQNYDGILYDIHDQKIQHHYTNNDNLRLVYHGNPSYLKNIRDEIKVFWNLMGDYCTNDANIFKFLLQPGQILIIDNTSFLHGRTPYDQYNNLRVLHRMNFYHNGLLRRSIKLGINKEVLN